MKIQPNKRNRCANILAHSINELRETFRGRIDKSLKRLCEDANRRSWYDNVQ